jgi:uncharacterized membrane protein YqaE (UPF0057 family)
MVLSVVLEISPVGDFWKIMVVLRPPCVLFLRKGQTWMMGINRMLQVIGMVITMVCCFSELLVTQSLNNVLCGMFWKKGDPSPQIISFQPLVKCIR